MRSIYLIIFALLVYIFFGMIVDTLMASNTSSRLLSIKIRILFYTYVAPIVFLIACIFLMFNNSRPLKIVYCFLITLSFIAKLISTKRKYLTAFQIIDNTLAISYLTPFLKPHILQFHLAEITDYEMTKANWLTQYPSSINVRYKDVWTIYEIINKTLKAEVKRDIAAVEIQHGVAVAAGKINPLT